jgi:hypothetical protein
VQELQQNLSRVWRRFTYSSYFPFDQDIAMQRQIGKSRWESSGKQQHSSLPAPEWGDVHTDDAFMTLMQILYGKALSQNTAR